MKKSSNVISHPMDSIGHGLSFHTHPPVRVRWGPALVAGLGLWTAGLCSRHRGANLGGTATSRWLGLVEGSICSQGL